MGMGGILTVALVVGFALTAFLAFEAYKDVPPFRPAGNASPGGQGNGLYAANASEIIVNATSYTPLLFRNIRFGRMPVKYYIDLDSGKGIPWFDSSNVDDATEAFDTWSNLTGGRVSFIRTSDRSGAQITVSWNSSLNSTESARTVGEGGPTRIVDTGMFNLTVQGELHLLPSGTKCIDLNRALHELGHVLGFGHTDDASDIMYPYESCSRQIGENEIRTLGSLYSLEPRPQLRLSNVSAYVHYGYIDLNFTVKNIGIVSSAETEANVYSDGRAAANVKISILKPGDGVSEYLRNIRIAYGSTGLRIAADPENTMAMWYRNLTHVDLDLG